MRRTVVIASMLVLIGALAVPAATAQEDPRLRRGVNFASVCNFSHQASDDPIVFPGESGASHLHQFFGNTSTEAASTLESMLEAGTTCNRLGDTAGYWVPAVIDGGEVQRPSRATVYYTARGRDPASIEAFPADFRIVAGGHDPMTTRWACLDRGEPFVLGTTDVPTCLEGEVLALRVFFPDCWDGVSIDSDDHRSHATYNVAGECPDTHPVAVPRIRLTVRYPTADGGDDLELSLSGHRTGV